MRFRNTQAVPPSGYSWIDPDIPSPPINRRNYDQWIQAIADFRAANNLSPITPEQAEDQNCKRLDHKAAVVFCQGAEIDQCVDGVRLHATDIARGTRTILAFKLAGSPLVSQGEADRRAAICATCYMNTTYRMPCAGMCGELLEVVTAIVGGAKTSNHDNLHACAACRCSLPAKVWIPKEILTKSDNAEIKANYSPQCWMND